MAWENTYTTQNLAHLGITATHERVIKPGTEYEQYFDKATGKTVVINDDATVHDTLEFVSVLVNKTLDDTKRIAQVLKRPTLEQTCKAIFDFFYTHYQYKLDEYGVEQVRRPTRAWADRKSGIDCDCFTASVSSVLTNLGIEHYLKIIAINGKPNFQHIYVVVPKRSGLDINTRANYWVIDPVLNHNDEEAPNITKTKHLKMNGIPLHQLNGIEEFAGLGNEFDGFDEELNGLDDESIGRVFDRRLKAHVKNTIRKIERHPSAVRKLYKPQVLVAQFRKLDTALETGNEAQIAGALEELSNTEHLAVHDHLQGVYDALHGHDDNIYSQMYGEIDDKMLSAVLGLGRRGRAAKRVAAAASKKKKTGFFTKVKNARKVIKSDKITKAIKSDKVQAKLKKVKAAVKKIGKFVKKNNPVAISARAGILIMMRTNFSKIAEKVYWALQTKEYAKSKGINEDYYNRCVTLYNKLRDVFVKKLGGDESALRKPILNGRAAKKIAKILKRKGMAGTTEELFGLGGLGAEPTTDTALITAALAFATPVIALMAKMFKGKKSGLEADKKGSRRKRKKNGAEVTDTVENENGTESQAPSDDAQEEVSEMQDEAANPSDTTIDNDNSIEQADAENEVEPSEDEESDGLKKKTSVPVTTRNPDVEKNKAAIKLATPGTTEKSNEDAPKSNTGLIVGGLALATVAAIALAKSSKKQSLQGLGNFSSKREAKKLKQKLTKAGIKLPHGYKVQKRKGTTVKTIKI